MKLITSYNPARKPSFLQSSVLLKYREESNDYQRTGTSDKYSYFIPDQSYNLKFSILVFDQGKNHTLSIQNVENLLKNGFSLTSSYLQD